ncbi:MAG: AsmA family protein [Alphaproteobacteria bacterium]|nr:AsmA family protein [Alphaproteobacteria bacterium]
MARALKIIRFGLGLLAGLAIAAAAVIYFVDFNEYRGLLAARLGEALGRPLRIDGDLKLRLGLHTGFSATRVSLANTGADKQDNMATIGRVSFGLALWPLLNRDIEIDHLQIEDAEILLQRQPDGRLNWELDQAGTGGVGQGQLSQGEWSLPRIGNFRLLRAKFIYRNGGEDTVLAVSALTMRVPGPLAAAELDLKATLQDGPVAFTGRIESLDALLKDQEIQIDGALEALGAAATVKGRLFQPLRGRGVDIRVTARTDRVQDLLKAVGAEANVEGKADVAFDLSDRDGMLAVRNVKAKLVPAPGVRVAVSGGVGDALTLAGLALDVTVQADDTARFSTLLGSDLPSLSPVKLHGRIVGTVARPAVKDLVVRAGTKERLLLSVTGAIADPLGVKELDLAVHLQGPDVAALSTYVGSDVPALGRFQISAALAGHMTAPVVSDLRLQTESARGAKIVVTGRVAQPFTGEGLDLRFDIAGPGEAVLADLLSWPAPRADALVDNLTAKGWIKGSTVAFQLDELDLRLKDSDVRGQLDVDLRGDRPKITADLQSKYLDLTRYFSSDSPSKNQINTEATQEQRLIPDLALDLAALALLDGSLKYQVAEMRQDGLVLEKLHLSGALQDGAFTLHPSTALLAKGQLALGGELNSDGAAMRLNLRRASMATLGPMLDFTALEGSLDLNADLRTRGRDLRGLAAALNGTASVVVSDGRMEADFLDLLAKDLLLGLVKDRASGKGTRLRCFANSYDIKDGVAVSQVLLLDTDNITLVGEGQTDLSTEVIRYHMVPRPKDPSLLSIATPINVSGSLANPSYVPDSVSVAGSVATAVVGNLLLPGIGLLLPLLNRGTGEAHPCMDVVKDGQAVAAPAKAGKSKSGTGILGQVGGAVGEGAGILLNLPGKILGLE